MVRGEAMTLYSIMSRRETPLLISAGCGYVVGRLCLGVNKVEGAGSGQICVQW